MMHTNMYAAIYTYQLQDHICQALLNACPLIGQSS